MSDGRSTGGAASSFALSRPRSREPIARRRSGHVHGTRSTMSLPFHVVPDLDEVALAGVELGARHAELLDLPKFDSNRRSTLMSTRSIFTGAYG